MNTLPPSSVETAYTMAFLKVSNREAPPPLLVDFTRKDAAGRYVDWATAQSYWYAPTWETPEAVPLFFGGTVRESPGGGLLYSRVVRVPRVRSVLDYLPAESTVCLGYSGLVRENAFHKPTVVSSTAGAGLQCLREALEADKVRESALPKYTRGETPDVRAVLYSCSFEHWEILSADGFPLDPGQFFLEEMNVEIHLPWGTPAKEFYKAGLQLICELEARGLRTDRRPSPENETR